MIDSEFYVIIIVQDEGDSHVFLLTLYQRVLEE